MFVYTDNWEDASVQLTNQCKSQPLWAWPVISCRPKRAFSVSLARGEGGNTHIASQGTCSAYGECLSSVMQIVGKCPVRDVDFVQTGIKRGVYSLRLVELTISFFIARLFSSQDFLAIDISVLGVTDYIKKICAINMLL